METLSRQPEASRSVLRDSADLNRLLAAIIRAHMLGDDDSQLDALIGEITPSTCETIAVLVEQEANESGRGRGVTPSAPEPAPLPGNRLAPAASSLSSTEGLL